MCFVKEAKDIEGEEDVRNLITSIILRQKDVYKEDDIVDVTMDYLEDSVLRLEYEDIFQLVKNSLDVFIRSGSVRCWNGKYETANVN